MRDTKALSLQSLATEIIKMANRGEKHFKNGGRNQSTRKYVHVAIVEVSDGNATGNMEIPVSCRPARAKRALQKLRAQYGNARLDKRKNVA